MEAPQLPPAARRSSTCDETVLVTRRLAKRKRISEDTDSDNERAATMAREACKGEQVFGTAAGTAEGGVSGAVTQAKRDAGCRRPRWCCRRQQTEVGRSGNEPLALSCHMASACRYMHSTVCLAVAPETDLVHPRTGLTALSAGRALTLSGTGCTESVKYPGVYIYSGGHLASAQLLGEVLEPEAGSPGSPCGIRSRVTCVRCGYI